MERLLVNRLSLELIKSNPSAAVGGKDEGRMSKSKLLKAQGVAAKLKNFL